MIHIDPGNLVFAVALIAGLILLLITVVLDEVVAGVLDGLRLDLGGGVSIAPVAFGFVAMFGVGGLFATHMLHLDPGPASGVGAVAGAGGALIVFAMFTFLAHGQPHAHRVVDLVGATGHVIVSIPKGHFGEVVVSHDGSTQQRQATADTDVAAGKTVTVTGVAGSALIVAPAT